MQNNLRDKYCIVGVGETDYSRGSGRSTRALAVEAIRNAVADAGLTTKDIDGMLSYHGGDSTASSALAYDLGNQLNFYMDCSGGGSSTEALVGLAIGAIEAGMCDIVAIFRAMNGYSQVRIGGTGRGPCARDVRRPDAQALRTGERGADVRVLVYPSHDGVRREGRGPCRHQGDAQQPRQQQPQGADEAPGDR